MAKVNLQLTAFDELIPFYLRENVVKESKVCSNPASLESGGKLKKKIKVRLLYSFLCDLGRQ